MFFFNYEPIKEENESKLSSQGDIRTDMSDESFVLDVHQYIDFCDEAPEDGADGGRASPGRGRALSEEQAQSIGSRENV